jgi:hypothetical protein
VTVKSNPAEQTMTAEIRVRRPNCSGFENVMARR